MIEKIKRLIITKVFYIRCYRNMKDIEMASNGKCSGALSDVFYTENCLSCPYLKELVGDK